MYAVAYAVCWERANGTYCEEWHRSLEEAQLAKAELEADGLEVEIRMEA